jgi:hypothetical protein
MKPTHIAMTVFSVLAAASAQAGYATGKVGNVVVGRNGNQVFIEVQATTFTSWPCATTHPDGYRYSFLLSASAGKEMLATVLTAQASGQSLQVVGKGTCTIDSSLEDADYVVLRP